jgi:hypothetical protein
LMYRLLSKGRREVETSCNVCTPARHLQFMVNFVNSSVTNGKYCKIYKDLEWCPNNQLVSIVDAN